MSDADSHPDSLGIDGRMDRTVADPSGVLRLTITPSGPRDRVSQPVVAFALVVDASLSMANEAAPNAASKWALAQRAAERVHGLLPSTCSLALVRFSQHAHVAFAGNRPDMLPRLAPPSEGDPADRWTNLDAALTVAASTLLHQVPDADIYRILLVTDGVANFGRWESNELAQVVTELADQGIGVDALGIGEDAKDEVLSEIVGISGQTQHVWATVDEVKRIDAIVTSLIQPVFQAIGGRGELRVRVHPRWTVEAVMRLKPRQRRITVPAAVQKATELRLPLPVVGIDEDRPVFLLRLRAPDRSLDTHTIVQVRGTLVVAGRRVRLDSRVGRARFKVQVGGTAVSDAEPFLEREERLAEFAESVAIEERSASTSDKVEHVYKSARDQAIQLGFDELADAYTAALEALALGVSAADAASGVRVRATRTRTRDLVDPDAQRDRSGGRGDNRKRLDDVLGNG